MFIIVPFVIVLYLCKVSVSLCGCHVVSIWAKLPEINEMMIMMNTCFSEVVT